MRNGVLAATVISGTLLVAACGTSTVPGSAYAVGSAKAMSNVAPSAPAQSAPAQSAPAQSTGARSTGSAVLTVKKTAIGYVLANATGYTVYWDSQDPKGGSRPACAGRCLLEWFPVKGKAVAAKGVTLHAVLGCITRTTGLKQATYNGYPLYTFGSDSAPGMINGNRSAGVWHVIKEKAP
jgi:predicted lipoprotein with Yx(FWY)xxD motif